MLSIKNLKVSLADSKKEILKGVSLQVREGEIHLLNGKNGSGKSTLVNTIMGNPQFQISSGSIEILEETYDARLLDKIDPEFVEKSKNGLVNIKISELEATERSLAGVFLANQYPIEIPGVSLSQYLRLIYNSRLPKESQLSVFKFKKILEEKAEIINYPKHLLKRNLNEGFSGGEKKKTEILQMIVLEPRYVMLDEIDSGLDRSSVQEVFGGIAEYKKIFPHTSFIIITHYDRAQEFLTPDYVHQMEDGNILNPVPEENLFWMMGL
jgi:Fe-S cluster assembly ATP-binding protein